MIITSLFVSDSIRDIQGNDIIIQGTDAISLFAKHYIVPLRTNSIIKIAKESRRYTGKQRFKITHFPHRLKNRGGIGG